MEPQQVKTNIFERADTLGERSPHPRLPPVISEACCQLAEYAAIVINRYIAGRSYLQI